MAPKTGYTLFDLSDRLRERGWQLPAYTLPGGCKDWVVARIIVRHGVSADLAALLLDDMQRSIEHFKTHPVTVAMTEKETSGFKHT